MESKFFVLMEPKMAKKMMFIFLLSFVFVSMAAAESTRDIFNSWIGHHYTQTFGHIHGKLDQTTNSITYDSSWTETKSRYRVNTKMTGPKGTVGDQSSGTEYEEIYHERWVVFYFDNKGIITTWRSYGWKM
jgi:hypothetical protein